jgi:hypothetical protein
VAGREVARHRDADALRELRVHVEVGDGVVEAVPELDELVRVDAVDDARLRAVLVAEALELLGERGAELQLEAVERDARVLGGLELVEAALVDGAEVLELESWIAGTSVAIDALFSFSFPASVGFAVESAVAVVAVSARGVALATFVSCAVRPVPASVAPRSRRVAWVLMVVLSKRL